MRDWKYANYGRQEPQHSASGSSSFQCNHGIELRDVIPDAVSNFMDRYCINIEHIDMPAQENLIDTFKNSKIIHKCGTMTGSGEWQETF